MDTMDIPIITTKAVTDELQSRISIKYQEYDENVAVFVLNVRVYNSNDFYI